MDNSDKLVSEIIASASRGAIVRVKNFSTDMTKFGRRIEETADKAGIALVVTQVGFGLIVELQED